MTTRAEIEALAREHKWRDAAEFLDYCDAHSRTERALFNGTQIGLCQIMAGYEEVGRENMQFTQTWRSCDLSDLVAEARGRLSSMKDDANG